MTNYAMDRVAARLKNINERWIKLSERISVFADNEIFLALAQESEQLRGEFADLASLGNPEAWRLLAESNHFLLPDESNSAALAEHIVRQHINIPELIAAIEARIGNHDG
jgi:hypothetical protein